jgi:hypothetical protein
MTKTGARLELQTIIDRWIDFDEWAYLQLEAKGEWSSDRQIEAEEFHKEAERKLREFEDETMKLMTEVKKSGGDWDTYHRSRWPEQRKLVNDWRRLGP